MLLFWLYIVGCISTCSDLTVKIKMIFRKLLFQIHVQLSVLRIARYILLSEEEIAVHQTIMEL